MSNKTLQEFIGHTRKNGLVQGSRFYVEILNGNTAGEVVGMYCESVNLPGLNIATTDTRIFGENRSVPYMPLYPDLNLTFLVDGEMRVLQFFEEWLNRVVNRSSRTIGYYNDYTNNMNIYVTDRAGKILYKLSCKEVYPKVMSDIRFDSGSRDFVKLDVNFALKYWEVDYDVVFDYIERDRRRVGEDTADPGYIAQPEVNGNSFNSILNSANKSLPASCSRAGSALSALTAAGPLSEFGKTMNDIGQFTGKLSSSMSGFTQGLSNILAPVSAVSNSLSGLSGLMGTLNGVTSTLGLGAPFAGAQSALTKASGTLSVVSSVRGLPGALSGVGSSMSSVGSAMAGIIPAIGAAAGGSTQVMDAVKSMGNAFSSYGSDTAESAGALQSQIGRGEY